MTHRRGSPWAHGLVVVAVILLALPPARAGNPAEDLLKALQATLKEKVKEVVADQLVRFDAQRGILEFSPLVLKFVGKLAKDRTTLFKEFEVEPEGNQIRFTLVTTGGTALKAAIVPQSLDLDLREFAVRGLLPEGINLTTDPSLQQSVTSFLDTLFGVPQKAAVLLQHVSFAGNTFRLTRPVKISPLGRLLEGKAAPASGTLMALPLSMENGRLAIHLGKAGVSDQVTKMLVELLLMKLKMP